MAKLSDKLQALRVGPELHLPRRSRAPKAPAAPKPARSSRRPGGPSIPRLGPELHLPKLSLSRQRTGEGLVGLEIEADSIAVAEVRAGGTDLVASAIAPLPPGAFVDGEVVDADAIAAVLREVFAEHKLSKRVRLGVANQRVVVRTMRMPAIEDESQLSAAIRFQAEDQIPMPIEQAVLDHRVVGGSPADGEEGPTVDIVVSAARRDMIASALKPLRDAGLQPVGVDLAAFGMIRALGGAPGAADPVTALYCNVGDATNLAIARGRACLFTRVSPAGLESVAATLAGRTGLTVEHARMWLNHVGLSDPVGLIEGDPDLIAAARTAMQAGASALVDEMRMSIDYYGAQEGVDPVGQVVIGGPGAGIRGLADQLSANLGVPTRAGVPQALSALDPTAAARLSLPYGLALEE
jgi:type IV pilus assembly protein PilM